MRLVRISDHFVKMVWGFYFQGAEWFLFYLFIFWLEPVHEVVHQFCSFNSSHSSNMFQWMHIGISLHTISPYCSFAFRIIVPVGCRVYQRASESERWPLRSRKTLDYWLSDLTTLVLLDMFIVHGWIPVVNARFVLFFFTADFSIWFLWMFSILENSPDSSFFISLVYSFL